jgi:hypothetical protein
VTDVNIGEAPSETDRQHAIVALRDRYAADAITIEDFSAGLDSIFGATTREELGRLVPYASGSVGSPAGWGDRLGSAANSIASHLQPGEELLWIGRPDPDKHFSPSDRFLVPFSLLWGGFTLFWEGSVIAGRAPAFFLLFGAAFVAVGLYFMFGRFIYKAHRKRRTVYAVTNRRVLSVVTGSSGETFESTYVRAIPSVSTNAGSDGSGSVMFTSTPWMFAMYLNSGMEFFARSYGGGGVNFFDIPDARAVGHLVDSLAAHGSG